MARAKKEEPASGEAPRNFEKDLEELEGIVAALEEGGLSLDEALKRFEQGIRLARCCEKTLSEAEKKIEILTRNAQGELDAVPFDEEGGVDRVVSVPVSGFAITGGAEEDDEGDEDEDGELLF